jgi:hypothetical protein
MMIWLLAVVLMASLAGLGYRQGAVRVAFSTVAILVGAPLALVLGRFLKPVLGAVGVKEPLLVWLLPPLIVFVIVSILFKVAAAAVHQKIEVHYKYHAGELRMVLWERLNRRLGLCLGQLNAVMYLILLSFIVYFISYATFQLASPSGDPKWMRVVNRFGQDLQSTGFNRVAASIDRLPPSYYQAADLAGLLYNNPLLEARLSRYPAFLGLGERSEFQALGADRSFADMRQRGAPIQDILDSPQVQTITQNPDLLKTIWATAEPDFGDLRHYLETGLSPKYDPEKILGRWTFDPSYALILVRRAKPNITAKEMKAIKGWIQATYANTSFVAMTDHHLLLKNVPQGKLMAAGAGPNQGLQTLDGEWKNVGGKYELTLSGGGQAPASIDGDRLQISYQGTELVFEREI